MTGAMMADDAPDEDAAGFDLFQEPEDFYQTEKPATFTEYSMRSGQTLSLRLVGSSPLWGHLLWNAGKVIARYLEDDVSIVKDKTVLELGAGAGLPSIVSTILGARQVVVTDYPDAELIDNLRVNVASCIPETAQPYIAAEAYLWGNETSTLTRHLPSPTSGFDILILADILFNHSEHEKLVKTVLMALKKTKDSKALVFFTPYRPWLLERDLRFFDLAKAQGLQYDKLFEHQMEKVMFENDPGDEVLRRTVFCFEVKWGMPA